MRIMGVDLGGTRTGLALSDEDAFLASPVGTIVEKDADSLCRKVAQTARDRGAEKIVVGYPLNMDGSRGESAVTAERFAENLEEISGIPVVLWDERMTTLSAIRILNSTDTRGKKRKAVVDTVSATVILQNYLDGLRE